MITSAYSICQSEYNVNTFAKTSLFKPKSEVPRETYDLERKDAKWLSLNFREILKTKGLGFYPVMWYTEYTGTKPLILTEEVKTMDMQENARLILGLRAKGWTDTEIADFLLYIESGDEQYKPKPSE